MASESDTCSSNGSSSAESESSVDPLNVGNVENKFYTYLICAVDTDYWKRGHSKDVQSRLKALRSANPNMLVIKRTALFDNKKEATTAEHKLKLFASKKGTAAPGGPEWFSYLYEDRQELYDKFEQICIKLNVISLQRSSEIVVE